MSVKKVYIRTLCPENKEDDYKFFIPAYQRGYRWTPAQVKDLLNDIDDNIDDNIVKKKDYCLQPLVVKKMAGANQWEVIDGQQRLTTIYLILIALCNAGQVVRRMFTLQTERKVKYKPLGNNVYYENWSSSTNKSDLSIFDALKEIAARQVSGAMEIDLGVNDYMKFFKDLFETEKNEAYNSCIDRYYVLQALNIICEHYYGGKEKLKSASILADHLKDRFYFLWYEPEENELSSEENFARLNSGKISLTNADLIKALLLRKESLPDKEEEDDELLKIRQTEIVSEWDNMEQILRSDEDRFWNFIADPVDMGKVSYFSRLELLFKLEMLSSVSEVTLETEKSNIQYHIYRFFEEQADKKEIWQNIKKKFNILREWYDDHELYHYIGFLSCMDPKCFEKLNIDNEPLKTSGWTDILAVLLKKAGCMEKGFFCDEVKKLIKNIINEKLKCVKDAKNIAECLDRISYQNQDNNTQTADDNTIVKNNKLIRELLLLANIQELIVNKDLREVEHKFPFRIWKHPKDKSEQLTLEHIQPQSLKLKATNNNFLSGEDLKKVYGEICNQLQFLGIPFDKKEIFATDEECREECEKLWQCGLPQDPVKNPQLIYNLALLQHDDNAALSNNWFFNKRKCILDITGTKEYIPLSTKHVFMKLYSSRQQQYSNVSFHYWEEKDAVAYRDALAELLQEFYGK